MIPENGYILIYNFMIHFLRPIPLDDSMPRYKRVQMIVRGLMDEGRLRPGDKIAAEVQVADALGVSKMTVNKALNALAADGQLVREVGRGTFVASPSKEPSAIADVTANKRLDIALSFVEGARNVLDSDYYGALYRGITDALHGVPGVHLHISAMRVSDYIAEQGGPRVDGRIVIAPRRDSVASLRALWETKHPLVVVGASWPGMAMPCVDSDNAQGARAALNHLIGLGHKSIALLYAEPEAANAQDRMKGYEDALAEAGLPVRAACRVEAEAVWKAGTRARARLVELMRGSDCNDTSGRNDPVTAIFAAGYYLALEAMNTVRAAGLRVPEDVSVVGFDDPLSAGLMYPPLTTVRQPLHAMGKRAGELIVALLEGTYNTAVPAVEMRSTHLIVRNSTAAPPLHGISGGAQIKRETDHLLAVK